jgi:signal peptidase I
MAIQPQGAGRFIYVGNSMYPTFRALDVLYFNPYAGREIKPGDIIIFKGPEKDENIVHRVFSIGPEGIVTRGDNCRNPDPWALHEEDVIGRVVFIRRDKRFKAMLNTPSRRAYVALTRAYDRIKPIVMSILSIPYHGFIRLNVFKSYLSAVFKPVVVRIDRGSREELYVNIGSICIGRYLAHKKYWQIRPPFKFFIDEKALVARVSEARDER